jgi:hypothetical protein
MKESLVNLNTAAKELARQLGMWELWTRIYVPNSTNWLRVTIEGYGGKPLTIGLDKEEAEKLGPVISEILSNGVKKAECGMTDASFARSFPPEGVDPENDGFW